MNSKRDSKDPMPTSANSARVGGGNDPAVAGAEKLGQKKAERVAASARFDSNKPGPEQPGRDGGGNMPVSQVVESHGQKKAERVKPSQRF